MPKTKYKKRKDEALRKLSKTHDNMARVDDIISELNTSINEKCVLSEELGHYYMDATYPVNTKDQILIDKQEYRAKKWSYYALIPFEKLKSAIKKRN